MIKNYNKFLLEYRNDILANPNFVKWFGKSKGVDDQGNPKVYYHATRSNFDVFNRGEFGMHFGTLNQANSRYYLNPITSAATVLGLSLIPVYLKFENPIRLNDNATWSITAILDDLKDNYNIRLMLPTYTNRKQGWDDIIVELKKLGYDSVIYKNEFEDDLGDDSIIVFDANQIKSAIGNTKFNLNSNNINENKL